MKNIIIVCLMLFSLKILLAQNQKIQNQAATYVQKKWTIEQVKAIASKYNLQDYPLLTESKNSALLYEDKADIEKWCQEVVRVLKEREERTEFLKNTKNVRDIDDYFKLIDRYPTVKQGYLNRFNNEQEMNNWRNKLRQCKTWRIYRNAKGGLAIRQGDKLVSQEESYLGQRIDNLPKF